MGGCCLGSSVATCRTRAYAHELLRTDEEQFEFTNPSDASIFLREFRSRHAGEFEGDVWTMLRIKGKRPVEIKITPVSTVISRGSMIEIFNILRDEINDVLTCRFGSEAKLHDAICVEDVTRCKTMKVKKALGISMLALVALAMLIAVKVATNANRLGQAKAFLGLAASIEKSV